MRYYAIDYTIHFDDTMAYGSHHFLTAFKFQCAAREAFLFGQHIYDTPGVPDALDGVHLFTADAYSRNLSPARLGDRVAILLSLEEWGRASARFCYRVIGQQGQPITAGYQTLICADATTDEPCLIPPPLWGAMEKLRAIEEPHAETSFRDRTLAGGKATESLFGAAERAAALRLLGDRYPQPQVIEATPPAKTPEAPPATPAVQQQEDEPAIEAWVFAGQGAFDAELLCQRASAYRQSTPDANRELEACVQVVRERLDEDATALVSGSAAQCAACVRQHDKLLQVAILLQNLLGAAARRAQGIEPGVLVGHSFGEIAALAAAGCCDLPTAVAVVCERVRAISTHAPADGGLLAVAATREAVAVEVELTRLRGLSIAGRNHQQQTVVSGPLAQLSRLADHLRTRGVQSTRVPTPAAFHHPSLRPAAFAWREALRRLPIKGPNRTVYSPIGRRFVTPGDDIPATLASQLLHPFDLQGGVSDLIASGVTRFVDCGSTGALGRLIGAASPGGVEVVACHDTPLPGATAPEPSPLECDLAADADEHRESDAAEVTAVPADQSRGTTRPRVAIVSQGCLLPGGATTPAELYEALDERRTGLVDQRDIDPHWAEDFYSEQLTPDRSTTHLAGRVDDLDIAPPRGFDPAVFAGLSRAQRLLAAALAPCVPGLAGAERVLCLVGATADGFDDHDVVTSLTRAGVDPSAPGVDQRLGTARSAGLPPHAAVQEVFNLVVRPGLTVTLIDAACASSLYATALGMWALESGEYDAVLAGGVFCPGPGNSCLFSQFRGTTATGLRPFDAEADGVIFSEGAAMLTLRRVADAQRQRLPMAAVLRGAGLSSDGRSSSANVPQTRGQILSLQRCYGAYGIDPDSIAGIEAHGTSTPVGDSTEIETLRQFFEGVTDRPVPVHSLKGLLGHAGWAAGAASVIAACEYLRRGEFPAQANFQQPSKAIQKANGVLDVLTETRPLAPGACRLAIDGFGFGGANGHLVLERVDAENAAPDEQTQSSAALDELVVVGFSETEPTQSHNGRRRFDREAVTPPTGRVILPDLQQDMDISQTLTMRLVDELAGGLPDFDSQWREQTGLILAYSGKTERGVEATLRVLRDRLQRDLAGLGDHADRVATAAQECRPSGPYTLQCMMPNVSAGRAALHYDLHGPNYVIDRGQQSLAGAMESAACLLGGTDAGGARAVMVAAVAATDDGPLAPQYDTPHDDFALALTVTTREEAERAGLPVLATVAEVLNQCRATPQSMGEQAKRLSHTLTAGTPVADASAPVLPPASACPIYTPVWVKAPLPTLHQAPGGHRRRKVLAIVSDRGPDATEVRETMAGLAGDCRVIVVGGASPDGRQHSVDLTDDASVAAALADIDAYAPDAVAVVDRVRSWDVLDALESVAERPLCQLLFLAAQRLMQPSRPPVELWGLYLDAWNGDAHPASGGVAGLLKAIHRESPETSVKTLCTRGLALADAARRLLEECFWEDQDPEVAYDGVQRLVRRLRQTPQGAAQRISKPIGPESVVIATGGARGVTSVMVEALLEDTGCTVIALGRSEPLACPWSGNGVDPQKAFYEAYLQSNPAAPPADMKRAYERAQAQWEVDQSVQRLASLSGRFEYRAVDITNRQDVARAVREIVAEFGRVDLLVHGAGVQTSKRLPDRTLGDFRRTYSVKVNGLRNLVAACHEELGRVVPTHVLTSAYSVFGNDGQHDYGAANETLDRACLLAADGGNHPWTSIAWLAWDGVGMTRGSEYRALAQNRGLSGVDAEVGQAVFRQVLTGQTAAAINVPMQHAEHVRYRVQTVPPAAPDQRGHAIETPVDLTRIECLPHHRVHGAPTLPGAWTLERMACAALKLHGDPAGVRWAHFRDVRFRRFVRHDEGRDLNLRVIAAPGASGVRLWMVGDAVDDAGEVTDRDFVYAEAQLELSHQHPGQGQQLAPLDVGVGNAGGAFWTDPYCRDDSGAAISLSGQFDCLRDIAIGAGGRSARFSAELARPNGEVIPALLLDSAWRIGAMHSNPEKHELYVPIQIGRIVLPIAGGKGPDHTADWQIRTTAPQLANGVVRWQRTEAYGASGGLGLVVEDALAFPLREDGPRPSARPPHPAGERPVR